MPVEGATLLLIADVQFTRGQHRQSAADNGAEAGQGGKQQVVGLAQGIVAQDKGKIIGIEDVDDDAHQAAVGVDIEPADFADSIATEDDEGNRQDRCENELMRVHGVS